MPVHMQKEIEKLKKKILFLFAVVEENVQLAIKAVQNKDSRLADKIIAGDDEVDQLEVEIEEECLKILALNQPVAIDLRYIISVLKVNNDLERIGDLAVTIAQRTKSIATVENIEIDFDFSSMADKVLEMLKGSLDALVNFDTSLAYRVCRIDDEVDDYHKKMFHLIKDKISRNPEKIDQLICYFSVSRCLERIADHATNISEDVIYMKEGVIIRHQHVENN